MKTKSLLFSVLIVACAGGLPAQNLVVNGGFETGDLTGWALSQSYGIAVGGGGLVHGGTSSIGLGAAVNTDLSQWLTTEVGLSYELSLWLAVDNLTSATNQFTASIGGVDFLTLVDRPTSNFVETRHTFIATDTSTLLNFNHTFADRFFYLDDVSVTATAIPEPAACAALAGLLGLGYVGWRRRRLRNARPGPTLFAHP